MKFVKRGLILIVLLLTVVLFCNYSVNNSAENKLYTSVDTIPKHKVGLVLGTIKYLANGRVNLYYTYRINAAVQLFKSNKIDYILVSGDNGSKSYDEPSTFKKDLMAKGIPEDRIILDYAGFRTLDSVVRAKAIFGQESITVISQEFHNERAIYLAEKFEIDAIGYNAKDVNGNYGIKVQIREYFARTKAVLDALFNVEPKYYGKPITIG